MKRLLLSLALCSAAFLPAGADAGDVRSYVAGNFTLEIDGAQAGFLRSVGDFGYTRIVDGKVVAQGVPTTTTLRFGFSSRPMLDWVASSLAGGQPPNLRVVARDYKLDAIEQYELPDFRVEEIQIPACDGSSKEPAYMRVRGRPSGLTRAAAAGGEAPTEFGKDEQKLWLPSNFRVTVAGVDATKINKLGPISVTRGPKGFEIAPFEITMAEITSETWIAWAEKSIVKGETDERNLKLELLAPNRTAVLATFELTGVSPVSMNYTGDQVEANADQIKRRTFKLAAKGIALKPPRKTKAGGKAPPKG